jgi:hypothetical protein
MIYRSAAGAAAVEHRYRELLRRWPVPNETLTVPTGAGETFVVASGSPEAPPVVALQGSGANAAMWLPQIERLARHLRVYAVDVIGEPGLSAALRPPLASDAYARWLDDVLAALGLGESALLGVYETERRLTATVPPATVHLLPEWGHLLPDQTDTVLQFLTVRRSICLTHSDRRLTDREV